MSVLQPGTVFGGRYVIEKLLAEGGMGAVYVAQHKITEEKVALKVLWPQVLNSPDAVARFQVEATIAARVGSDYIVKVSDAGFEETLRMPFLVMELLRGKTLQDMVEQRGALTPVEVISLLTQVASALDKAHRYSRDGKLTPIIHRDLKPENIFFTRRENGEPVVKILDFGIAKILSENTKVSRDVKGTPLYMAYEQATGTAITPQTDIWALGLIAFFLLSGRMYWKTANNPEAELHALFVEILSLPLDPPSQRIVAYGGVATWGNAFDAWFARAVNRDPAQRYSSAGLAIAELSDALGLGDPTLAVSQLNLARTNIASTRMQSLGASAATQAAPPASSFSQAPAPISSASYDPSSFVAPARSAPGAGSSVGVFDRNSTGIRDALGASAPIQQASQTAAGMSRTQGTGAARTPPIVYAAVALALVSLIAVAYLAFNRNSSATTALGDHVTTLSTAPSAGASVTTAPSSSVVPTASASTTASAPPTTVLKPAGGSTSKPSTTPRTPATAAGGDGFDSR